MSGHSKWSTIKHKKGLADAKRSKMFTKVIRELTVAARIGGGDPGSNPRLRLALGNARAVNMPNENVQRAIKRGTGELEGVNYEEVGYEGYGPGGVAVLVQCLTDNRNRTVSDIRRLFAKHRGALGESGCVHWMFQRKGMIELAIAPGITETDVMNVVLDYDVEDVQTEEDAITVYCAPGVMEHVRSALEAKKLPVKNAKVSLVPQNQVALTGEDAQAMVALLGGLEDHDDVQDVISNFDIDEKELEQLVAGA